MKKLWTAAAVLLICLVLAGCREGGLPEPEWDADTLVYAHTSKWNTGYREMLDGFKKAHPELTLEVRDYTGEGGRDRLLAEVLAGNIPDIIELDGLPYQRLAQLGYLEDLWPYIENDPEIGRENVMEAPLKAAEEDGKLCMVFRSVNIHTLTGPTRLVGERTSWTVKDLLDAFSRMPEGSTITDYYATKDLAFLDIFAMSLDGYVDWERGKCDFDSEGFRSALEFVGCFPDEVDWSAGNAMDMEELSYRRQKGLQMLSSMPLTTPANIVEFETRLYGEQVSFVGYPVGDGSVGSGFVPSDRYAISTACHRKDAAWDLLRTLLLPRYNFANMKTALENGTGTGFPVNRADFETMMRVCMSENGYRLLASVTESGNISYMPPVSEEQMARFRSFYDSIGKLNMISREIYDIVWEQAGAYFAGDKTMDETVDLIERRVDLYMGESR